MFSKHTHKICRWHFTIDWFRLLRRCFWVSHFFYDVESHCCLYCYRTSPFIFIQLFTFQILSWIFWALFFISAEWGSNFIFLVTNTSFFLVPLTKETILFPLCVFGILVKNQLIDHNYLDIVPNSLFGWTLCLFYDSAVLCWWL